MQEITIYEHPYILELPQDSGHLLTIALPAIAEQDAHLLAMWLFGKSEQTQSAYASDMGKLYKFIGQSLSTLTLYDFQQFTYTLTDLKPATRARTTAAVKSALTFLSKAGLIPANVGAVVKLPKPENKLAERIMSERQVYRMIDMEANTRNHAILTLLYYGGLRAAELCNLQWRHLQERSEAGQVALYGKGNKTRFVLLDTETWEEVMQLRTAKDTADSYVFRSRQARSRTDKEGDHGRIDESMIHRIVRAAADRAGIQPGKVSPHWMRHAHATYALERGALMTEVQADLGHASIETTAKYTHIRPTSSTANVLRGKKSGQQPAS
jgi:integrase/recombinase XerD